MKHSKTINAFFYLACLISLSFFLSCGDTEDTEETIDSIFNPFLDEPDEQWLQLEDEDWEKLKDENWVRLTDEEVKELMTLDIPQDWGFNTEAHVSQKYHHATLFQKFGDIPQVRFIVEFERMERGGIVTLALAKQIAAHAEATYFITPNAVTRRSLERTRNLLRSIEEQEELRLLDQLRIEDPKAWVKGMETSEKLKLLSILYENWNWSYREQTRSATLILRHTKLSTAVPVIPCLTYSMLYLKR